MLPRHLGERLQPGVRFDQPGDELPHGEVDMQDGSWPISQTAHSQETFHYRLHPGLVHRPPASGWAVIPVWLGYRLPAVVEHHAQSMNVGEVTLGGKALVACDRAVEERHVRPLPEPPHGLHQGVDLRLVDRPNARIARVQDDATDGPEDGLTGVRTVAEPHGLLDEGVDVAAERETH